ncbi:undecaprenyl-diphosphatase [Rhodoblastus sphagnicola]|uniref:phosphatase PAP2 family protein n=1 Tax=Rhodoblastus sphagnicola TaxID=333368 RepID=UPI00160EEBEE|nr:phosphatase PAP2 family protein [Rhodoblastus sphagnicola]MBB4198126.1 undecaprenyl-diphosphatase [Rhodoblastus sphagnicola]
MEILSGLRQGALDAALQTPIFGLPRVVRPTTLGRLTDALQAADLFAVDRVARTARPPLLKALAIGITRLGNGWIYPLLLVILLAAWGTSCLKIVVCAALSAAVLHGIYPIMKRAFRRRRPFEVAPELPSLLATLDSHSFPSGHTMTMVGVLTPIVMLWPAAIASAALMAGGMAWSRVATAHHYPSDVLAGAALGLGVGYPMTLAILHIWG